MSDSALPRTAPQWIVAALIAALIAVVSSSVTDRWMSTNLERRIDVMENIQRLTYDTAKEERIALGVKIEKLGEKIDQIARDVRQLK